MHPFLQELRRRRFIEWVLAYVAGAMLVLQLVDAFGAWWGLSRSAAQGIHVALGIGFLFAVVLSWYHGPRGRQEPTGTELLILILLLLLASLALALVVDEPFLAPGDEVRQGDEAATIRRQDGVPSLVERVEGQAPTSGPDTDMGGLTTAATGDRPTALPRAGPRAFHSTGARRRSRKTNESSDMVGTAPVTERSTRR